jgi:hypothetical protein
MWRIILCRHEASPEMQVPMFPINLDRTRETMHFLFRRVWHTPSLVKSLKSLLSRRAQFFTSRSWIPNPSWSLGCQSIFYLAGPFFFSLSYWPKNLDRKQSNLCITPFRCLKREIIQNTMFLSTELMRADIPWKDSNFLFQLLSIFLASQRHVSIQHLSVSKRILDA